MEGEGPCRWEGGKQCCDWSVEEGSRAHCQWACWTLGLPLGEPRAPWWQRRRKLLSSSLFFLSSEGRVDPKQYLPLNPPASSYLLLLTCWSPSSQVAWTLVPSYCSKLLLWYPQPLCPQRFWVLKQPLLLQVIFSPSHHQQKDHNTNKILPISPISLI